MKKRVSIFLVLTMLLTMIGSLGVTSSAEVPDGYTEITSAEDFISMINANPSGKFYLTQDITLGSEEAPISTPIATFSGELIGADAENLPTITMYIDDTTNTNVGLFGSLDDGKFIIQNIKLAGSVKATALNAARNVGALAGEGKGWNNSEISNCVNEASVSLTDTTAWGRYTGGFIGNMYNFSASGVTFTGLVNRGNIDASASNASGGIIGVTGNNAANLTLVQCENYGTISNGIGNTGGIVGWPYKGRLENCYNAGQITGTGAIGGIFGLGATSEFFVTDCYNIGAVSNPIGNTTMSVVSDCYYLGDTDLGISGATAKTVDELKILLEGKASPAFLAALDNAEWNGYTEITTAAEFQAIKDNPSGRYYLSENIDLSTINYEPIENFSGTLLGDNETVLKEINLGINDTQDTGLFRSISGGAVIKNIKLTGTVEAAGDNLKVGALAGKIGAKLTNGSEIANVINDADVTVTGAAPRVGGILGDGSTGDAMNESVINFNKLVNTGDITLKGDSGDQAYTGGIFGYGFQWRSNGKVKDCENYGNITIEGVSGRNGGIGGRFDFHGTDSESLTMENCYNGGNVIGGAHIGGLVGQISGSSKLVNCYNAGDLVRENYGGGGIVYTAAATNILENCYSAGKVNGVHPAFHSVVISNAGTSLASTGFLGTEADERTGLQPMTLAQMKGLTDAPQGFKDAMSSIYSVTVETPENGTLTPSGLNYVDANAAFSVTAEADEGYRVKNVKAGGVELIATEGNVYTTTVNSDVTITAEFEVAEAVPPTVQSPAGGAFILPDAEGSITFGTVTENGFKIVDYGIVYSNTEAEPTVENGEKLSASGKALVNGQFGVQLIFNPVLKAGETYYTRPYVVYENNMGEQITVYGDTVISVME